MSLIHLIKIVVICAIILTLTHSVVLKIFPVKVANLLGSYAVIVSTRSSLFLVGLAPIGVVTGRYDA